MKLHLIIFGKVQGVFFRRHAKERALKLALKGYVRNLSDGAVEVVAEGAEQNLKELIEFCKRGPQAAKVENIKIKYGDAKGEFEGFEIKY